MFELDQLNVSKAWWNRNINKNVEKSTWRQYVQCTNICNTGKFNFNAFR